MIFKWIFLSQVKSAVDNNNIIIIIIVYFTLSGQSKRLKWVHKTCKVYLLK